MRPTARQHIALAACVEGHRELYNAALQERRDAWRARRIRISYGDQSAQLKDIRRERPDVAVWSFSSQQATLRRLNRAFEAFFRRVKTGNAPGYPRFKAAPRFDSVEWPRDGDGARWHLESKRVYLQGVGQVKVIAHRAVLAARTLVETYDLIAVEDLAIANMVRRATPHPVPDDPGQFLPNGAAAKTGLNRSIYDAGWRQFVSILRAKAEDAGRTVIEVDPRHTSDRCEACGHAAKENRVTQAVFECRCGRTAQADEHAARNILRAGVAHQTAHAA